MRKVLDKRLRKLHSPLTLTGQEKDMKWFKTTEELRALCQKLAHARIEAGISQEEVAVRIGTHQTVISKIDSGKLSDTIGEALTKSLSDYAVAMSLSVPDFVESSKARNVPVVRTRSTRERRALRNAPVKHNEAAQLGVLNLVASGSLKPQDALALLKSL